MSDLESNSEDRNIEVDLGSERQKWDVVQNSEDFRSLLNSNSGENKETTLETVRLVNTEGTRRIEEINSAINEKTLPFKIH